MINDRLVRSITAFSSTTAHHVPTINFILGGVLMNPTDLSKITVLTLICAFSLTGISGCIHTSPANADISNDNVGNSTATRPDDASVGNVLDANALVASHNKWRAEVGTPALKWSDALAKSSQAWADTLKVKCAQQHSTGDDYGENIFWGSPLSIMSSTGGLQTSVQNIHARDIVDSWGEEKKWYDYQSNSCKGGVCGHYTQVVWKDTTEVGCGMVICNNKAQIWVCQYKKPGNFRGQRPY
jgi:pathogenesis-related protein 1